MGFIFSSNVIWHQAAIVWLRNCTKDHNWCRTANKKTTWTPCISLNQFKCFTQRPDTGTHLTCLTNLILLFLFEIPINIYGRNIKHSHSSFLSASSTPQCLSNGINKSPARTEWRIVSCQTLTLTCSNLLGGLTVHWRVRLRMRNQI